MRRALQEARLTLAERDRSVQRLGEELSRLRDGVAEQVREGARAEVQRFLTAIGTPLVHLVGQEQLHRTGAAQVGVADVLETGRRLVRRLEDEGLRLVGAIGETTSFDPGHHEPLSMSSAPERGQAVVVRTAGLAYHGRVLRKAGVEGAER